METTGRKGSCIIPSGRATRAAFVVFGISAAVFGLIFMQIWGFPALKTAALNFLTDYIALAITLLAGMILHEIIHATFFTLFCRDGFRSVSFGVNWRHLAPYVTCSEALTVKQYAIATAMPGIILGLLPALYALASGTGWFLVFGVFFTAGSASDFLSLVDLRSLPRGVRVTDHADEAGFDWHLDESN